MKFSLMLLLIFSVLIDFASAAIDVSDSFENCEIFSSNTNEELAHTDSDNDSTEDHCHCHLGHSHSLTLATTVLYLNKTIYNLSIHHFDISMASLKDYLSEVIRPPIS